MGSCTVCNQRVATVRLHRQKDGVSWKDFKVAKFCNTTTCRKRQPLKLKEERHSN
jgi:hypothetical protein